MSPLATHPTRPRLADPLVPGAVRCGAGGKARGGLGPLLWLRKQGGGISRDGCSSAPAWREEDVPIESAKHNALRYAEQRSAAKGSTNLQPAGGMAPVHNSIFQYCHYKEN